MVTKLSKKKYLYDQNCGPRNCAQNKIILLKCDWKRFLNLSWKQFLAKTRPVLVRFQEWSWNRFFVVVNKGCESNYVIQNKIKNGVKNNCKDWLHINTNKKAGKVEHLHRNWIMNLI